ncbi:MAG: OmpA family protein [Candidatus Aminicenantes bacterium]|nr:OmpA family protein [Candidatus Aminicenantes bacterium]
MKWKIYSVVPDINPIYREGMEKFIEDVKMMTDGQITIEYIPSGEKENIDPIKVFDAVSKGEAEMGFGSSLYWAADQIPGNNFMYTIPFGLNSRDMYAWLTIGRGLELLREIYVPYNVVPFPIGDTGGAMGGWFNRAIKNIDNFINLRIRQRSFSKKIFKKLGATIDEITAAQNSLAAFEDKRIDAIIVLGPYTDMKFSLHKGPRYYYYPGWQEPCGVLSLIINKNEWDELPENFKKIFEIACDKTYYYILDRFNTSNSAAFIELQKQGVKFMEFPPAVLDKFREYTNEVLEEEARKNTQFAEIYRSFRDFKENKSDSGWDRIVQEAVYSETTVLKFKKELQDISTVGRVYQRGNKNVVISLSGDASFNQGSAEPSKTLKDKVPNIAKLINENSISIRTILVEGHTDNRGSTFNNWRLSRVRAIKVVELLVRNGINDLLIRPVFYGDTCPINDNKTHANRRLNRRVEIVIEF